MLFPPPLLNAFLGCSPLNCSSKNNMHPKKFALGLEICGSVHDPTPQKLMAGSITALSK